MAGYGNMRRREPLIARESARAWGSQGKMEMGNGKWTNRERVGLVVLG
jgi:hypothetical protein